MDDIKEGARDLQTDAKQGAHDEPCSPPHALPEARAERQTRHGGEAERTHPGRLHRLT